MRSLAAMTNGVASIDRTIAASSACRSRLRHDAGGAGERAAARSRIRPPAPAPGRRAARCPAQCRKRATTRRSARTCRHQQRRTRRAPATNCATTSRRSSIMPTVTKNRPSSTSRNGLMSSSTWKRYSVSEISMPARNAPSTSDRPATPVRNASSSVISSTLSTNSSFERRRATDAEPGAHQPRARRAPRSASAIAALPSATAIATPSASAGCARAPASARAAAPPRGPGTAARRSPRGRARCRARRARRAASRRSRSTTSPRCRRARARPARTRRRRARSPTTSASRQPTCATPSAEHDAAHGDELRQAEFQPDREHQEHDAEFGERVGSLRGRRRGRARAARARARSRDSRSSAAGAGCGTARPPATPLASRISTGAQANRR